MTTRISLIVIGSEVFVGVKSVILPGVTNGDRVDMGADGVVTKNLEGNSAYAGNPVRRICSYNEYIEHNRKDMDECTVYDGSYIISVITGDKRCEMQGALASGKQGFVC